MRILAIGPHPDDIEFGCGGTLLRFKKHGSHIFILVMSQGEMGTHATLREKEQRQAAKILGAELSWGGFTDTQIPYSKESINKIEEIIQKTKASLIFAPCLLDTHQDHRHVAQSVVAATRYIRNVLFYEVPTTYQFEPSIFMDIGQELFGKLSLLKTHKSQVYQTRVPKLSILESAKSTAIFRGYQNRIKYAEGFMPLRFSLGLSISG